MKKFSVDNGPWKSSLNVDILDSEGTLIIQRKGTLTIKQPIILCKHITYNIYILRVKVMCRNKLLGGRHSSSAFFL